MRPEAINYWLAREPFTPFRLSLSNGRTFDVHDPHTVTFFDRNSLLVGELDPDFPFPVLSKAVGVPLIHINSIEPLLQPASAG